MNTAKQHLTYNPFQKTATVTEGAHSCAITYGTDRQRKKTVLKNGNTTIETKIYSGRYEKLTTPTGTKELHYIPTPVGTVAVHIKGATNATYYLLKDYLGSTLKVVNASGATVEEHSYDAWGNHRNPADWALSDFVSALGIRGYTGHEHLPHFQLVNMNGRMYDPVIGRVLSPDRFVQSPFNAQVFNRYSYCLNNPLRYTDPSGEIISTIITAVVGFVEAVVRSVAAYVVGFVNQDLATTMFNNAWSDYGKQMTYAWRIDTGLIKSDPNKSDGGRVWEIVSRFTWQLPQTIVGNLVMTFGNVAYQVQNVTYDYGMTAVDWGGKSAVTIGNYSAGPRGYTADWRDHLFVHEYGHYIQSQQYGPVYLLTVGIPSIQSAILQTDDPYTPRHDDRWFEADASYKGAAYFDKHYGSGKDGYVANSLDYFDRNSFIIGTPSYYENPRTGNRNRSVNPISGEFHWTDIPIYIPIIGLLPYLFHDVDVIIMQ
jgi:RHS repeat-associated protein